MLSPAARAATQVKINVFASIMMEIVEMCFKYDL
jgi:hypothetical protein